MAVKPFTPAEVYYVYYWAQILDLGQGVKAPAETSNELQEAALIPERRLQVYQNAKGVTEWINLTRFFEDDHSDEEIADMKKTFLKGEYGIIGDSDTQVIKSVVNSIRKHNSGDQDHRDQMIEIAYPLYSRAEKVMTYVRSGAVWWASRIIVLSGSYLFARFVLKRFTQPLLDQAVSSLLHRCTPNLPQKTLNQLADKCFAATVMAKIFGSIFMTAVILVDEKSCNFFRRCFVPSLEKGFDDMWSIVRMMPITWKSQVSLIVLPGLVSSPLFQAVSLTCFFLNLVPKVEKKLFHRVTTSFEQTEYEKAYQPLEGLFKRGFKIA